MFDPLGADTVYQSVRLVSHRGKKTKVGRKPEDEDKRLKIKLCTLRD